MQVIDVRQQIIDNKLDNFYVFTGNEVAVRRAYINKISEVKNLDIIAVDTVAQAVQKMSGKSFIKNNFLYVVFDDFDLLNTENAVEKIQPIIADNILILVYSQIDKRCKFYKKYADKIVEFEKLPEWNLIKQIQKRIDLSTENCKKLIDCCDGNFSRILSEIDKIQNYSDVYAVDDIFNILLKEKSIYCEPKDAIFDLCDSICKRECYKPFRLYEDCLSVNESPLTIISVLYNNLKQMLQVQSYTGNTYDICDITGLSNWQVKNARDRIGEYTIGEVLRYMKMLRTVETKIKTGEIEPEIAVDYIMVNML